MLRSKKKEKEEEGEKGRKFNRGYMYVIYKASNIDFLALYRNSMPTPGLDTMA